MSLFIGSLAFLNPEPLAAAKFGILAGSLSAGIIGSVILLGTGRESAGLHVPGEPGD